VPAPRDARGADPEARAELGPSTETHGSSEIFQYAVLRVVPSVERGEGLNVGVVLHARRHRFLDLGLQLDEARLGAFDPALDLDALGTHLDGLARIARGEAEAGAIAAMPRSDRFGWLAAPSNTIVQPSPVHTGVCEDPVAALARLVARLVAPPS
jgi:hypothetical protein